MKLTVLVLVDSDQIQDLSLCLSLLSKQSHLDFEVLVLSRGAVQAVATARSYAKHLPLKYLDCPESAPWPLSVQKALRLFQGEGLVCLTASTLLNPQGLSAYANYLKEFPQGMIFGYTPAGLQQTPPSPDDPHAPSRWFPEHQVGYLDYRFTEFSRKELQYTRYLLDYPYWFATPTNFGLTLANLKQLQGFKAGLNWEQACVDLAYRCYSAGGRLDFLLDAWAEQLIHPPKSPQKPPQRSIDPLPAFSRPKGAQILFTPRGKESLLQGLFDVYAAQDLTFSQAARDRLSQPRASLNLGKDPYTERGKKIYYQRPAERKPDFMIIGVQKAGTGSLYQYLSLHPQLLPANTKEVHFFDRDVNYAKGFDWYLNHFFFEPGKLSYEATASYFKGEICPARMAAFAPALKMIALLREPTARLFSAWKMYQRRQQNTAWYVQELNYDPLADSRSLAEAITEEIEAPSERDYLRRGKYAQQLRTYLQHFKRAQILLLDFELLATAPHLLVNQCCQFLGVPEIQLPHNLPAFNRGNHKEKQPPPEIQAQLEAYYAEDKRQLREEFGLDFGWLKS